MMISGMKNLWIQPHGSGRSTARLDRLSCQYECLGNLEQIASLPDESWVYDILARRWTRPNRTAAFGQA